MELISWKAEQGDRNQVFGDIFEWLETNPKASLPLDFQNHFTFQNEMVDMALFVTVKCWKQPEYSFTQKMF